MSKNSYERMVIAMVMKNDKVMLKVTDMTFEGFGVAKYNDEDTTDFIVFVKDAAVGDTVNATIVKVLPKYCYAVIDDIVIASDKRKEPACAVWKRCGGCSFSHITYDCELEFKRKVVCDMFHKNYPDNNCEIDDIVPSPSEFMYRNKVQMPFSQNGKCGFFAKRSHRVAEVSDCILNDAEFAYIANSIEEFIETYKIPAYNEETGQGIVRHLFMRRAASTGEIMVCIVINSSDLPHKAQLIKSLLRHSNIKSIYVNINRKSTNVILSDKFYLIWGFETIFDYMCGLKFEISPLSFYQVNSKQAEAMYKYVKENAGLCKTDVLLDLYCGIGTITLIMADSVKYAYGIEIIRQAVDNATKNARSNNITNATFFLSDANNASEALSKVEEMPNVIIVDPPRKGLDDGAIEFIKNSWPEKFIYISCNPSTLTRDIALLNSDNNYKIQSIRPFDMFPRTSHVETVVIMRKNGETE